MPRLRASIIEPATSTTDTVGLHDEQRLARDRRVIAGAAAGAAQRVDRIGARREPGRRGAEQMPVTSASPNANASTIGDGFVSIGRKVVPANASDSSSRAVPIGDGESDDAAGDGEEDALDQRLRDDLPARRADRQPQRRLAAPRDRAREQQVGDVGAGDQQHQSAHAEQDAQAAAVLLPHDADAAARRHDRDHLPRQALDHVRHPVRRIARVVLHPLAQDAGEPRADAVGRRAGREPADHAQPRGDRLAQERRVAVDQRLLVQRNPQIGRIAAQRLAEEPGRRHADDRERMPLDDERGADDRRIAAVGALPDVMAHHDDRRRRRACRPPP